MREDPGTEASFRDMLEVMFVEPEQRLPRPYYQDEWATLYHGDCREILPLFANNSIDFIFTDPPYGHNNNNGDLIHNREAALGKGPRKDARPILNDGPEAAELIRWSFPQFARLLMPGCCCCCCCCGGGGPDPQFARWSLLLDEAIKFKHAVVWDKGGLGMGWHYRRNYELILIGEKPGAACRWYGGNAVPNVLRIGKIIPTVDQHPTEKPIALGAWFIRLHTQCGDVVLDPFAGSGTTLVAAKQLGRKSIGIELEEKYCALAAERLRNTTPSLFAEKPTTHEQTNLFP